MPPAAFTVFRSRMRVSVYMFRFRNCFDGRRFLNMARKGACPHVLIHNSRHKTVVGPKPVELLHVTGATGSGLLQLSLRPRQTCPFYVMMKSCVAHGVFWVHALFPDETFLSPRSLSHSYPHSLESLWSYLLANSLYSRTRIRASHVCTTTASNVSWLEKLWVLSCPVC